MPRPVTLFTGQWADLPLETLAQKAKSWGYDGLELASWGDHLDVLRAAEEKSYADGQRALLKKHGLDLYAFSIHLAGQLVGDDPLDERHAAIYTGPSEHAGKPEAMPPKRDPTVATSSCNAAAAIVPANSATM